MPDPLPSMLTHWPPHQGSHQNNGLVLSASVILGKIKIWTSHKEDHAKASDKGKKGEWTWKLYKAVLTWKSRRPLANQLLVGPPQRFLSQLILLGRLLEKETDNQSAFWAIEMSSFIHWKVFLSFPLEANFPFFLGGFLGNPAHSLFLFQAQSLRSIWESTRWMNTRVSTMGTK